MKVFISHSNKDSVVAIELMQELKKFGISVWTYEKMIDGGTDIVAQVESELKNADFVVILLSQDAVKSTWVKREYTSRLSDDLSKGRESIITVRLDNAEIPYLSLPIKWIDFRTSFADGLSQLKESFKVISPTTRRFQQMFEAAYLLLLIDQFPNGLWGPSLAKYIKFYGHDDTKEDSGSISVSTWCSFAITHFTGSEIETPLQEFRQYLLKRRSGKGAFGMKRSLRASAPQYTSPKLVEHTRHTATALNFFLRYDSYDDERISKALQYLFMSRTPKGLWTEIKPFRDEDVDPITVSNVIDTFERVYTAIQQKQVRNRQDEEMLIRLDEAISDSLNYLFLDCRLRTPEGFWLHDEQNAHELVYQHTVDVLANITASCIRSTKHLHELNEILDGLISIARRYDGGIIPPSSLTNVQSLYVTSQLVSITRNFSRFQEQIQVIISSLPDLCVKKKLMESSAANGWFAILLLYGFPEIPSASRDPERIKYINSIAQKMKDDAPDRVELPPELTGYVEVGFVRDLLRRRKGV